MANFTWTFDAPTGTYKQRHLSASIYQAAVADSLFAEHASPVGNYGKHKGEQATLKRVKALTEPTSPVLTEGIRISEDSLTINTRTMTVQEIGRAVPYTSLAEDLGDIDPENVIQKELRRQMKLSLDTLSATAFKEGQIKYIPTGVASRTINTDGTTAAAAVTLNTWHLEEIRDYLATTLFAPKIGDSYLGIFAQKSCRGIKRDPAWEEWHKYTDPSAKWNNEIGRWEDIRIMECNHTNALSNTKGTGSVLGEGVVFGDNAVVLAEAVTPELRAGIPADFGRLKSVAWYGVLVFRQVWGDSGNAGEANVVHVTSS